MEKIRLAMKDDVEVTSKKSLRENWDLERIVSYYRDGSLHRFLTERWCKGEAAKVEQLESITDTRELQRKLCEIFDMPFVEEEAVDVEEQERREKRLEALRAITSDNDVLANVDKVAFDQEELADLLDKDEPVIYLVNNEFSVPLEAENKKYIGVGKAVAEIYSDVPVDFNALGIEFKNVTFDEKYAGIAKSAEPKLEMAQSEQPVSDIVARMKQVTEKCWNEVKYELADAKVYFDHTDEEANRMIETAIKVFMRNNPTISLDRNDFVAVFYPGGLHYSNIGLQSLLLCNDGFYFENEVEGNGFVRWEDIVVAFFKPVSDVDAYLGKHDKIFVKLFNGCEIEIAERLNNAIMYDFIVQLINQLKNIKDADDLEIFSEPSETAKRMITVVEDCKRNVTNLDGDIFVRNSIPKKKLDNIIKMFSIRIPAAPIRRNEIIALYCCHFKYYCGDNGKGCSLNTILITEKGFYYNKNELTEKEIGKMESFFWAWDNMESVGYKIKGLRDAKLKFIFKNDGVKYIHTREGEKITHEEVCNKFLVPLLTKLKSAASNNSNFSTNSNIINKGVPSVKANGSDEGPFSSYDKTATAPFERMIRGLFK